MDLEVRCASGHTRALTTAWHSITEQHDSPSPLFPRGQEAVTMQVTCPTGSSPGTLQGVSVSTSSNAARPAGTCVYSGSSDAVSL